MSSWFIRTGVRAMLTHTRRSKVVQQCERLLSDYTRLAKELTREQGQLPVEVPPMRGVDPDMRNWSFFNILEHNAIVNRSITATVVQLANGEALSGLATLDPKTGVMPAPGSDETQVAAFADSILEHLQSVKALQNLKNTATSRHPVFGEFDGHKWNAMFAFHLGLHLPQARTVAEEGKRR